MLAALGLPALAAAALLAAAAPSAPAARPSLVLLTLDTTRADHLGAWGWRHARTPSLDGLAARGARFARCDTAAAITLPSHATLLTGLFPPAHGVRDNGTFALAARFETVAERLAARGYDTAAVVSAVVLARRHGLDQGFRRYDDDLGAGYAAGTAVAERPAERTTEAALAALASLRPPFFLWVHYFDPHDEYRPPGRFAEGSGPHRLYDGEIAFMDEQIGRLLARLPAGAAVVAVGDHGEMLGEGGEATHGLLLGAGARRVPLLLAGPGVPAGAVRDCLVRTADVAPTLLALAGIPAVPAVPAPGGLDGASLLPLLAPGKGGAGCDRTAYSESFLPFFAYRWYPLRALGSGRFLYVDAPRPSLYDLAAPGGEDRDLAAAQPAALRRFQGRLEKLLAARGERLDLEVAPGQPLPDEERRRLASLGYLGGGESGETVRVSRDLPDPRAMAGLARELDEAAAAVQQGRCAEALPALEEVVRRDPHNAPAMNLAAHCLLATGRAEAALALYRRSVRENRRSATPAAGAGASLLALGRRAEAERAFRHALALDPSLPDAAAPLARLLRERGERAGALALLDAALAAGGRAPAVYLERGLAREAADDPAGALADFREAARRAPAQPAPLEHAARAAYALGQTREAALLYEQVLRLAPARLDLWKTLGAVYLYQLDDGPSALRAFRRALALEADPAERQKLDALVRELGG